MNVIFIVYLTEASIYVLFFVILMANVGFLVFWAYSFFSEIKKTLMIKHAWVYKLICVCHKKDQDRFEREQ
jgi:hypothetical protein